MLYHVRSSPFWPSIAKTLIVGALALFGFAQTASATLLRTYVTGDLAPGGAPTIFAITFDPTVADSASVTSVVTEARGFGLDGIDFVPGTGRSNVVVGAPIGKLSSYNVFSGATLPDIIVSTNAIATPPAGGAGTSPSTVYSTPTHVYYIENQFGFGTTPSQRIIRKPFAGGPEEVVFGGGTLSNFEGIEIVGSRLYFFAKDPGDGTKRALMSIGLSGGVHDGAVPVVEKGGLAAGAGGDGSDELAFDPVTGKIYGTNIINGEVTVVDPFVAPGTSGAIFISGADVAAGAADALRLLARSVDGIRSDGLGHLIFVGRGGVVGAINIAGVVANGADNSDVIRLYDSSVRGTTFLYDDLTPLAAVPSPATWSLFGFSLIALAFFRRGRLV